MRTTPHFFISLNKPVPTFLLTPSKGPFPISYSCYLTKDSMFWLYQVPEIQVLISSAWSENLMKQMVKYGSILVQGLLVKLLEAP
ncbi:hypothetical protein PHAVU_011G116700 [Phaseolus vulgaris]|uniref:Uncharacterized protein n=1 Tax=Phaseolus vulgaris TaxID=3885 RepID=V7AGG4_PHAVU|nr:hypothetical protein PHAVU_011G116700g [Phaseolus vulgaris]ESW04687.1 hypothetical protein PHAVU_011G116700g [Phaseolus vulgaris]